MKYDFCGWATRNNLKCSDGRTIMRDAFRDNDGKTVPLVWNHQHNDPSNVLGHALLENREDGVYTYCAFNDSEDAQNAKIAVQHGDVVALSIYANRLKHQGHNVIHGEIREVSLVLAGANPGAYIEDVMSHSDSSDYCDEAFIFTGEELETGGETEMIMHSDEQNPGKEKTVGDVFNTLTEEQKTVVYALIGEAIENAEKDDDDEGDDNMKHNVFDNDYAQGDYLSHADQEQIIRMAKSNSVGSLQEAINMYLDDDALAHGFDDIESLFPDYEDLMPGAPEKIPENDAWIHTVMSKVHKTPYSRIRTRQADVSKIRAEGYTKKGTKKKDMGNISLVTRQTDPQTVYIKDKLNRDDIIDITDFDVVQYQYGVMKGALNEELATAFLVGDGREEGDEQKISPVHIRPIWQDDELYTIHTTVDFDKAKASLQGTNTNANFGENYIYSEAIIESTLYAREQYKGSGALDFFCTPHLLNKMLLARDLNGHRIYKSKADLTAALNVNAIHTVEKFEGLTRSAMVNDMPATMGLLGLFVNLNDYDVGAVKRGEITHFNQFDIDFNQEKFMMETRLCGALKRVKSAIALEEKLA